MLTIGQLIQFDHLGLHLVAGDDGLHRPVAWAHTSELPDPTVWLEGSELVMTTGIGLPRSAQDQVTYLERLDARNLAGLVVAPQHRHAPPLSRKLLARADELAFPIMTVRNVPFTQLAQAVAAGNRELLHERFSTIVRIYGTLGELARTGSDIAQLLDRLSDIVEFELSAVTPHGVPLFPGTAAPPVPVPVELLRQVLERPETEAQTDVRIEHDGAELDVSLVPIVARRHTLGVLIGVPRRDPERSGIVLRHIATVVSLLGADVLQERERARREGSERLARQLAVAEAGTDLTLADVFAEPLSGGFVYAAIGLPADEAGWADLHQHLGDRGIPHVMTTRGDRAGIVAQLGGTSTAELGEALTTHLPRSVIGISSEMPGTRTLLDGRREARWALQRALAEESRLRHYERVLTPNWLALDSSALEIMVEQILGPLLRYDEEHGSELVKTLTVLLEEDRRWKTAADRLFVHRQTLIQRGKRIEQLTGRRLSSTRDVTDLWLALRAREALMRSEVSRAE